MPLCFSSVQFDFDAEAAARPSRIIIERSRTTSSRKVPVPVVYPPPPPVYPIQCIHTETQVVVAEPQERAPEPAQTIFNININEAASEIAEDLARENTLRNQVAALENSLEEQQRARVSEESARYEKEVREIYKERESRHQSRSRGGSRESRSREVYKESRSREVYRESRSREVSVGLTVEDAARDRTSHEYRYRSSSLNRIASPRGSGDRLMITERSPRHSDSLVVNHTRHRSHEIRGHRCSLCNRHGHESAECSEGESNLLQIPVRRVRYWQV